MAEGQKKKSRKNFPHAVACFELHYPQPIENK